MLKSGFTTGSCAAAASKAAAQMIFEQKKTEYVSIVTPKGIEYGTEIFDAKFNKNSASCAVKKYSGDDPDVTNGIMVYSKVTLNAGPNIKIDGGIGVGRVTKAGLRQKIGEAAINKVPLEMIESEVRNVFEQYGFDGGAEVIISVPEGVEIAKRTFNPKLGIEGGISILGTSGIVEPMSEKALIDSLAVEINVKKANDGDILLITPGNYGIDFIKRTYGIDIDRALKCSNYIGDSIEKAVEAGFEKIMLIGHIGKLVKLAGGIMNTHSKNADCRMEILAANAAFYTENIQTVRKIMDCITTEQALGILKDENIADKVMKKITEKAYINISNRTGGRAEIGLVIFSNDFGILGESENAKRLIERIKENAK